MLENQNKIKVFVVLLNFPKRIHLFQKALVN
jgi:hypothetical protein